MSIGPKPRILDEDAAFRAMCTYVEAYWGRSLRSSNDIAELRTIMHDDPATADDWAGAVDKVVR